MVVEGGMACWGQSTRMIMMYEQRARGFRGRGHEQGMDLMCLRSTLHLRSALRWRKKSWSARDMDAHADPAMR